MIKFSILMISIFLSTIVFANSKIRKVIVNGDQIITVRTALGIATIIQVPDRPNSVVIGDQNAFKVEYLDQAVTIKPIQSGAKTNIYIYTDWKRYNVELITGNEPLSDYVVYLVNPNKKESDDGIHWTEFKNSLKNSELALETSRLAKLKNGILQVEFYLSSDKKLELSPEWFWLTQKGKTKPIHNLILSSLEVSPKSKVQGVLQVLVSDLERSEPFKIEVRRNKVSFLTVKKVDSWK